MKVLYEYSHLKKDHNQKRITAKKNLPEQSKRNFNFERFWNLEMKDGGLWVAYIIGEGSEEQRSSVTCHRDVAGRCDTRI